MSILIARKHLGSGGSGIIIEPPPIDYLATLKSLMHFDAAHDSQIFDDELPNIWTPQTPGILIKNTEFKFGGSSMLPSGESAKITTDGAPFALNVMSDPFQPPIDFEMDLWFYLGDSDGGGWGNTICTWRPDVATGPFLVIGGSTTGNTGKIHFASGTEDLISATSPTLNVWHHLLINRHGSVMKMFLDGIEDVSGTVVSTGTSPAIPFAIGGGYYTLSVFRGYIDEFRFSINTPERISNFTPPIAPYVYP